MTLAVGCLWAGEEDLRTRIVRRTLESICEEWPFEEMDDSAGDAVRNKRLISKVSSVALFRRKERHEAAYFIASINENVGAGDALPAGVAIDDHDPIVVRSAVHRDAPSDCQ